MRKKIFFGALALLPVILLLATTVVASPPTTREEATRRPGASATPKGWIKAPKTDSPSLLTQKGKEGAKDIGQRLGGCLLILVPVAFALVLFMERRGRR